jgi:hypothetical protein
LITGSDSEGTAGADDVAARAVFVAVAALVAVEAPVVALVLVPVLT